VSVSVSVCVCVYICVCVCVCVFVSVCAQGLAKVSKSTLMWMHKVSYTCVRPAQPYPSLLKCDAVCVCVCVCVCVYCIARVESVHRRIQSSMPTRCCQGLCLPYLSSLYVLLMSKQHANKMLSRPLPTSLPPSIPPPSLPLRLSLFLSLSCVVVCVCVCLCTRVVSMHVSNNRS
jgi:hypothetical protein